MIAPITITSLADGTFAVEQTGNSYPATNPTEAVRIAASLIPRQKKAKGRMRRIVSMTFAALPGGRRSYCVRGIHTLHLACGHTATYRGNEGQKFERGYCPIADCKGEVEAIRDELAELQPGSNDKFAGLMKDIRRHEESLCD